MSGYNTKGFPPKRNSLTGRPRDSLPFGLSLFVGDKDACRFKTTAKIHGLRTK